MAPNILLSCESISKRFGAKPLFSHLSLSLAEGDHVGVVGPNGSGKSTLLKILAGVEPSDEGVRTVRRHIRIGYVAQDSSFPDEETIEELLERVLLADGVDPHEERNRIAKALSLGEFPRADVPVSQLSGGWKKRLAIAQTLMMEPDVLLMDEPTNHLDVDGILWLERILRDEPRAFLVVSHDRRFLESVASRMIEVNRCYQNGLFEVNGRYSDFLEKREDLLRSEAQSQASLANRVRREIEWLRRGPKARTTKAKARIDAAGNLIEELRDVESRKKSATAGIDFVGSGRQSKQLLVATNLGYSIAGRPTVSGLDLRLEPGQRLGLLGPNGSGKTTLLKLLAGTLTPVTGSITRADKLRIVTFEQHRESLDQTASVRSALAPSGDAVIFQDRSIHLVSWAKRFLFRPEQLDLPVSRLSGGEQARLLIARLMLQPADLLILDEPTNDLDIPTLDVLEESLSEFPGALVLVTHDRWLLDRLSTKLLALDGQGKASWFADYAQWESARSREVERCEATDEAATAADGSAVPRKRKGLSYRDQREWEQMERLIVKAEEAAAACQASAHDPVIVSDADALRTRYAALHDAQAEVDRLYARWAELDALRTKALQQP
ncbi:ABC-type transport system, ATPase component [Nitrospira sp. KM1]|uniref:ABC-F family ATP-binding cassette domain-containing protein n=1 Tax=Nitrospira sp. KM1 TaxID=1936990 RepID=UPI0013A77772|nr:ABC-F family ATP-binding cassette domain-containing protein [Nitrospira sp. KM1]BCA54703.1 ABC-type transport system, ATPase component [Nitrospira sp. KM1]